MTTEQNYDALFAGVIGQEYQLLKLLSPLSAQMSHLVGCTVATHAAIAEQPLQVVELGGGTGITTLAILSQHDNLTVLSIDNEPVMQNQAKQHLHAWFAQQKVTFCGDDALTALRAIPTASVDVVASAYTLHNFSDDYRALVITESLRILKAGGHFINGDRYALDEVSRHTRLIQEEVSGYFKVLIGLQKLDVLEHWIVHLFSDESANHIMRETSALAQLKAAGFVDIKLSHRQQVNALVTAVKPALDML
ncbi:MAG: class I SAM-dependent methyltransferase [Methylococcaceae bacterium]|nr:class I SAM-dependent methyltransferase [Methylococcaceae bacterium]